MLVKVLRMFFISFDTNCKKYYFTVCMVNISNSSMHMQYYNLDFMCKFNSAKSNKLENNRVIYFHCKFNYF